METLSTHFFIRRREKDGSTHRCGCVAIKKLRHVGVFKVAYSAVSPSDKFVTSKARTMALGRLESTTDKNHVKMFNALPGDFNELIVELDIARLIDRFDIDDTKSDTAYAGACKNLTPKAVQVGEG